MKLSAWYAMNHPDKLEHGAHLNKWGIIERDKKTATPSKPTASTPKEKESSYNLYRVSANSYPSEDDKYYIRKKNLLGALGKYEEISYDEYKKLLSGANNTTTNLKIDPITGKAVNKLTKTSGRQRNVSSGSSSISRRGYGLGYSKPVGNRDTNSSFIKHSGVVGMKWGVRNGPPYPLDSNPKVQAAKKAEAENDKKQNGDELEAKIDSINDGWHYDEKSGWNSSSLVPNTDKYLVVHKKGTYNDIPSEEESKKAAESALLFNKNYSKIKEEVTKEVWRIFEGDKWDKNLKFEDFNKAATLNSGELRIYDSSKGWDPTISVAFTAEDHLASLIGYHYMCAEITCHGNDKYTVNYISIEG